SKACHVLSERNFETPLVRLLSHRVQVQHQQSIISNQKIGSLHVTVNNAVVQHHLKQAAEALQYVAGLLGVNVHRIQHLQCIHSLHILAKEVGGTAQRTELPFQ